MGVEKAMVSAKLSARNIEFIEELRLLFQGHSLDLSQSSAVNSLVSIARERYEQGDLKIFPEAWQVVLRKKL